MSDDLHTVSRDHAISERAGCVSAAVIIIAVWRPRAVPVWLCDRVSERVIEGGRDP